MRHRVKVIDRLEIAWDLFLGGFVHFLFFTIDEFLHLHCFLHDAIEPIDTCDV